MPVEFLGVTFSDEELTHRYTPSGTESATTTGDKSGGKKGKHVKPGPKDKQEKSSSKEETDEKKEALNAPKLAVATGLRTFTISRSKDDLKVDNQLYRPLVFEEAQLWKANDLAGALQYVDKVSIKQAGIQHLVSSGGKLVDGNILLAFLLASFEHKGKQDYVASAAVNVLYDSSSKGYSAQTKVGGSGGGQCHAEMLLGAQLGGFIGKYVGKLNPGKGDKTAAYLTKAPPKPVAKGHPSKQGHPSPVSNSNSKMEGAEEASGGRVKVHAKLYVWPLHPKVEEQLCTACQKEWGKLATAYANHPTVDFSWAAV